MKVRMRQSVLAIDASRLKVTVWNGPDVTPRAPRSMTVREADPRKDIQRRSVAQPGSAPALGEDDPLLSFPSRSIIS